MENIKLSVVVPAYNEGNRIAKTLGSVADYLNKQSYEAEVLVIANNCTDNTVEVSKSYTNRIKNLRVVEVPEGECSGKGCAVKIGIYGAKGQYILFMDADNATKLHEVENFWPYFDKGYQVVIGSRYIKGSKFVKKQTMMRRFISRAGNILIQAVLLPGTKDSQCGFKVFTREAALKIFKKQKIDRWGFDLEVLALAKKYGYKVKEVPVTWEDVGGSVLKTSDALKVFKELFQIRWNLWMGKYNDKKSK